MAKVFHIVAAKLSPSKHLKSLHMLRLSLPLLLLLSVHAFSQTTSPLQGKWKLVAIHDDEIFINYKTGSDSLSPTLLAAFENAQDSTNARNSLQLMRYFFSDMVYSFDKDGHFQLLKDGHVMEEGTYSIDNTKKVIKIVEKGVAKKGMHFSLHQGELHIESSGGERTLYLTFEGMN